MKCWDASDATIKRKLGRTKGLIDQARIIIIINYHLNCAPACHCNPQIKACYPRVRHPYVRKRGLGAHLVARHCRKHSLYVKVWISSAVKRFSSNSTW